MFIEIHFLQFHKTTYANNVKVGDFNGGIHYAKVNVMKQVGKVSKGFKTISRFKLVQENPVYPIKIGIYKIQNSDRGVVSPVLYLADMV